MICVVYKHAELEAGKDTSVFERNSMTLVIQDVPKLICPNCGEEYTDPHFFWNPEHRTPLASCKI